MKGERRKVKDQSRKAESSGLKAESRVAEGSKLKVCQGGYDR